VSLNAIQKRYDNVNVDVNDQIDKIVKLSKRVVNKRVFNNHFLRLRGSNRAVRDANTDEIIFANKTLDKIYDDYVLAHNTYWNNSSNKSNVPRRNQFLQPINIDYENESPFKSNSAGVSYNPPDFKLKPLLKLFRPYFSPKMGSYEVDVVFGADPKFKAKHVCYLFCININTKYLFVYIIARKDRVNILQALNKLMTETYVTNIRGDGDFKNISINGINFCTNSDSNVQHNRIVDRVIRTIRDAIGSNYNDFNNYDNVYEIIDIYN
jgi:hypothetical protein